MVIQFNVLYHNLIVTYLVTYQSQLQRKPINISEIKEVRIPLSPPAEKQNEINLTKFKDLVGFFLLQNIKLFIKYQTLGVLKGVTCFFKIK